MVDDLSDRNRAIRAALLVTPTEPEKAIALLSAALVDARAQFSMPDIAAIAKHLATLCDIRGDRLRALAFYEEAVTADPTDPHTQLALGMLFTELKRVDEARKALSAALHLAVRAGEEDLVKVLRRSLSALPDQE